MGRKKNIDVIQVEEKKDVTMSDTAILESVETEIDMARQELEKVKQELAEHQDKMKKLPMREVDADEMVLVKKQITRSVEGEAKKAKVDAQKAYDNVMVTGKFINRRHPGQPAKLTYIHHDDDPVKWYDFEDGKAYTIPQGFADEIKQYYHKPNFIQKQGGIDPNRPSGAIHSIDNSQKLYDFVPLNF